MRIVAGKLKGRRLITPKDNATRPTSDRNRESLFNVISHRWPEKLDNSQVLDVFAGTGALGFEALSRGAAHVTFVEKSSAAQRVLQENKDALHVGEQVKCLKLDVVQKSRLHGLGCYDLIFADPPYGKGLAELAINALHEKKCFAPQALLVLEEAQKCLPDVLPGFDKIEERNAGQTVFGFYSLIL